MREISLRLRSFGQNIHNISIVDNGNLERRMLNLIFMSFGALGLSYILILGNMVFNIVERRQLDGYARTLSTEVRELELSYLSISNDIDLAFSHSLGFKETEVKFATRKSLGSLNGSVKIPPNEI